MNAWMDGAKNREAHRRGLEPELGFKFVFFLSSFTVKLTGFTQKAPQT